MIDHAPNTVGFILRPDNVVRARVACLHSDPLLDLVVITRGYHRLRFADSKTPCARRKARGAAHLQLIVNITDNAQGALPETRYQMKVTRNPFVVPFDKGDNGKFATYHARWVSTRGEFGPWSLPLSTVIAA